MYESPDEREVEQFLADVLTSAGHEVLREARYSFADGNPLVADLVAKTPDGDLLVFEIGKPTPEKLEQLDRFERATGVRPELVDPEPFAAAIQALRQRDSAAALARVNATAPWYVRLKGAARSASGVIGRNIKAALGRIKFIELALDHRVEVTSPDGTKITSSTGLRAHVEFHDKRDGGSRGDSGP
jgi:hypothetical protein